MVFVKRGIRTELRFVIEGYFAARARLFAGALLTLFLWFCLFSPVMQEVTSRAEIFLLRVLFTFRGERLVTTAPLLVTFGAQTAARLKPQLLPGLPMPRSTIATALERIIAARPRLLLIDASARFEGKDDEAAERIARALSGAPVVLSAGISFASDSEQPTARVSNTDRRIHDAARLEIPMLTPGSGGGGENKFAMLMRFKDADVTPEMKSPLSVFPALKDVAGISDLTMPAEGTLINFYGPPGFLPRIDVADVLDDAIWEQQRARITNQIIFFGEQTVEQRSFGALRNKEMFSVPVSAHEMYGVEILATRAANLLDRSWLTPAKMGIATLACALMAVVIGVSFAAVSLRVVVILAVGLALCSLLAALIGFYQYYFLQFFALIIVLDGIALLAAIFINLILHRRKSARFNARLTAKYHAK